MNIIDYIDNNLFLKKLFPAGLNGDALIGQVGLSLGNRLLINIHTKQQPTVEVSKWGKWSQDYDVIVIELLGLCGELVSITNWKDVAYGKILTKEENRKLFISQSTDICKVEIECDGLIFQRCTTYIDGGDDPAL